MKKSLLCLLWLNPFFDVFRRAMLALLACVYASAAFSFTVTNTLEAFTVPNVGTAFQSVTFDNTYSNPIVVCNGITVTNANWLPVVRIDGLSPSGMSIRVQKPSDVANDTTAPTVAINDVHCIVSETGLFQLPNGTWYQAGSVLSDGKNYRSNWNVNQTEEVFGISANLTGQRGVLAQIMTSNDARGQVPHINNCTIRNRNPFDGGRFCVGRHTFRYATARLDETVGYIVFQTGAGNFVGPSGEVITMSAGVTSDTVRSVDDSPPYTFSTTEQMQVGVTTQQAEDGGDGSYSGLYGTAPLAGAQIDMALDEGTSADRNHTTEFVAWWSFGELPTSIDVQKDVDITSTATFDLLTYSITVENTGDVDFEDVTLTDTIAQDVTPLTLLSGPTLIAGNDTDNDGELDTDETWTYSATYQLTDDNFEYGDDVVNEVSVEAAVNTGSTPLPAVTDTATTVLVKNPLVEVIKTSTLLGGAPIPAGGVSAGDQVVYSYDINNIGNVALAPLTINDAHFGSGPLTFQGCVLITDSDSDSILGGTPFQIDWLGATDVARCTSIYTVTQADIDAQ